MSFQLLSPSSTELLLFSVSFLASFVQIAASVSCLLPAVKQVNLGFNAPENLTNMDRPNYYLNVILFGTHLMTITNARKRSAIQQLTTCSLSGVFAFGLTPKAMEDI